MPRRCQLRLAIQWLAIQWLAIQRLAIQWLAKRGRARPQLARGIAASPGSRSSLRETWRFAAGAFQATWPARRGARTTPRFVGSSHAIGKSRRATRRASQALALSSRDATVSMLPFIELVWARAGNTSREGTCDTTQVDLPTEHRSGRAIAVCVPIADQRRSGRVEPRFVARSSKVARMLPARVMQPAARGKCAACESAQSMRGHPPRLPTSRKTARRGRSGNRPQRRFPTTTSAVHRHPTG